jgi:hypothetical protein
MLRSSFARLSHRLLLWGVATLALWLTGCDTPGPSLPDLADMSKPPADLRQSCDGAVNITVDLRSTSPGRTIKPGEIGSPCTTDTDCLQGAGQRVCFQEQPAQRRQRRSDPRRLLLGGVWWRRRLWDKQLLPELPTGRWCLLCRRMQRRRDLPQTDYLCMFLDTVSACLPRFKSMTCTPTDSTPCKTVLTSPAGLDGGCVRQAYEDDRSGICYPTCKLGATCPQDSSGTDLSCRFLSSYPTGDHYAGNLCLPGPSVTPKPEGATCVFADECQAGLQCDLPYVNDGKASRRCRTLCDLGASSASCPTGQACHNAFGTCSGAGLCRPL